MDKKKLYTPPHLIQYSPEDVPKWVANSLQNQLVVPTAHVSPQHTTLVDIDRRYVRVSKSFSELLGYENEELIGKRFDEVTAPKTNDIPVIFTLFKQLGYMHGLWLLLHRTGERILIRYESRLRPDSFIESNIEVVHHLR